MSSNKKLAKPKSGDRSQRPLVSKRHVAIKDSRNERQTVMSKPSKRSSVIIDSLPDEILMLIFSYLDASDLLISATVCRRWLSLTNDNVLWQAMYEKYLRKTKTGRDLGIPLEAPTLFWKRSCMQKSKEFRNERAFSKLKRANPFTLMPQNTSKNLQEAGVTYTLAFFDGSGTHHYIRHNDCFYHHMAVTARWYNFDELPPLSRLKTIKLLSFNPVFYDQKGKAGKNSPCERSLLHEYPFNWSQFTSKTEPIGSDPAVNTYSFAAGLLISVWKDGGGLAYITANFHYNRLIDRCLKGTFKESYKIPTLTARRDDVDTNYGFHGYQATVELRNQRQSIWSQQFRNLYSNLNRLDGGSCQLIAIRPDQVSDHTSLDKAIELPWKTELFKNKTTNVCILDVTLWDEHGRLVWSVSDFISASDSSAEKYSYDYGDTGKVIQYRDEVGQINITIDKIPESGKEVVSSLVMCISSNHISSLFVTI